MILLSIIPIAVKNSSQFHHFSFFIYCIVDSIFPLGYSEADETSIGKMRQLFRIRRTGRTAETKDFEEDLTETFGIGMSKFFECRENGF